MITALVLKDVKLFFRNRLFAALTALGLVMYSALYLLLPATADDSLSLGIYFEAPESTNLDELYADAFEYEILSSQDDLISRLDDGELIAGLAITEEAAASIAAGEKTDMQAFLAPGIPGDVRGAYEDLLGMIGNMGVPGVAASLAGIEEHVEVLGPDLQEPLPVRDGMIPMLLMFLLAVESMGLATLIVREVATGTAAALLSTPLRSSQFFGSKVVMGVGLALAEVMLLLVVFGKLGIAPLQLILTILVGCLMFVGVAFLVAAVSKDNMSVMAWTVLFILIFAIPGIGVVLPGMRSGWAELIPSYFLIDALHRTLNFGAAMADIYGNLGILLIAGAVFIGLGWYALGRQLT